MKTRVISLQRLCKQYYDGASAISGIKCGVAKQISDIEPRALFTHCYAHALNLAVSDVLQQSTLMSDTLNLTHEITKLIKCSPSKEGIFRILKKSWKKEAHRVLGSFVPPGGQLKPSY